MFSRFEGTQVKSKLFISWHIEDPTQCVLTAMNNNHRRTITQFEHHTQGT